MFRKAKRKIVAAIMSVLVLLWAGTLGIIGISSYLDMEKQNEQMLRTHAAQYTLRQNNVVDPPPERPSESNNPHEFNPEFADTPRFQLSVFYTVALSYHGEILETRNEPPTVYTDGELEALAIDLVQSDATYGTERNLAFYRTDKGGYFLITFMDNTLVRESAATLIRYTLIFGGIAMILFFALALFLSGKIVRPLEQSYAKQKQFISDAGHELKTPLTVVHANAELLTREVGENQWLANIRYENERMSALVSQLLELARTEQVAAHQEQIDLCRLVNGEVLPFESVAFEHGITLVCHMEDPIVVMGNSAQLKQLISVLVDNAIRHSRAGATKVTLSLTREHGAAKFSIINDGDPIPREQRERIFDRFYRMDDARSAESGHYGLGLAIAKSIVRAHRGKIDVFCANGLVEFCVWLPHASR